MKETSQVIWSEVNDLVTHAIALCTDPRITSMVLIDQDSHVYLIKQLTGLDVSSKAMAANLILQLRHARNQLQQLVLSATRFSGASEPMRTRLARAIEDTWAAHTYGLGHLLPQEVRSGRIVGQRFVILTTPIDWEDWNRLQLTAEERSLADGFREWNRERQARILGADFDGIIERLCRDIGKPPADTWIRYLDAAAVTLLAADVIQVLRFSSHPENVPDELLQAACVTTVAARHAALSRLTHNSPVPAGH